MIHQNRKKAFAMAGFHPTLQACSFDKETHFWLGTNVQWHQSYLRRLLGVRFSSQSPGTQGLPYVSGQFRCSHVQKSAMSQVNMKHLVKHASAFCLVSCKSTQTSTAYPKLSLNWNKSHEGTAPVATKDFQNWCTWATQTTKHGQAVEWNNTTEFCHRIA